MTTNLIKRIKELDYETSIPPRLDIDHNGKVREFAHIELKSRVVFSFLEGDYSHAKRQSEEAKRVMIDDAYYEVRRFLQEIAIEIMMGRYNERELNEKILKFKAELGGE